MRTASVTGGACLVAQRLGPPERNVCQAFRTPVSADRWIGLALLVAGRQQKLSAVPTKTARLEVKG
jgi:hypothetical protein